MQQLAPARALALALACAAAAVAQDVPVNTPSTNWTMEGGSAFRESVTAYDRTANAWSQARFFYFPLNEGSTFCSKAQPDTASATPIMVNDVWIVCGCTNMIHGFGSPDKYEPGTGGPLTPLWTWDPASAGFNLNPFPLLATPVVSMGTQQMFVLYKDATDAMLFSLQLNNFGLSAPTLKWQLDLSRITGTNDRGTPIQFRTFSEDHAILYYGGRIWVPSQDYAGALIVDPNNPQAYITTMGLGQPSQRLRGSVGGMAQGWRAPVFVAHGSGYGIQSFNYLTGNRSWWSDNEFQAVAQEFSHPVAVSFWYGRTTVNCIVATQWDSTGDIFLSAANANSSQTCGWWDPRGYYIRNSAIAQPLWVSAPAVLYDGNQIAYLIFAVQLPSGDGNNRGAWRSTLITIMIDQSGPYLDPVDVFTVQGARFNAAPLVIRDAWGPGNHAVFVGDSAARLHVFPAKGYTQTGPVFSHTLIPLLPPPNNPNYPAATNRYAGISGNYMAASRGGAVGFIVHNEDAETNFFCVLAGAMFVLPTDPTPSPTPPPPYVPTPSPQAGPANDAAAASAPAIDATAAVFGTFGAIALAAIAIVLVLPQSAAAEAIRSASGSVVNGAKGLFGGGTSGSSAHSPVRLSAMGPAYTSSSPTAGPSSPLSTSVPVRSERQGLLAASRPGL